MNIKTKTVLLFIVTLISGIIIGALGAIQIQNKIVNRRLEKIRHQKAFIDRMERILRPETAKREEFRRLFRQYHQGLQAISAQFREEMKAKNDSLLHQAKPLLNERQFRKLERIIKRKPPWLRDKMISKPPRQRRE